MERVGEAPFDSGRKMMSTVHWVDSGFGDAVRTTDRTYVQFTKGAPDIVISRCTSILTPAGVQKMTEEKRAEIREVNHNYAIQGHRSVLFQ